MSRERVALVTPESRRRVSAAAWAPLLSDRADLHLCESFRDEAASGADLVVVDEACPDLDVWIERAATGREPDSIVVFGSSSESQRGAVPWGNQGTDVLAMISDFLDRKRLVRESDEFLRDLRESNERLEDHRKRFSRLVLKQADALRGANVNLSREVEGLTRLQSLARFFAAPGPDSTFPDRLAQVAGRALGAFGVAVAGRTGSGWTLMGHWRISPRNASGILPRDASLERPAARGPSTRKGLDGWWIPIGENHGLAALIRSGERPGGKLGPQFLESVRSLTAEGIESRTARDELLSRSAQVERILQTLRGGLLKIDGRGRITLANPACAEILGASVSSLQGKTLEEAFPRDAHLHEILRSVSENGGSIDDAEISLTTRGGRRVSVSVRASSLGELGESPGGVLVLLSDLSRRKEVEEEVRKADRLSALGRLSAGVAHEIRNPLAGIRTTAEILRNRVGEGELQFVDVILEETCRLDRIVGSLLQFAKPAEPRIEPVEIGPLLERVRQLAASRAAERRVTIRVEAGQDLPTPGADRDQILQVLLNLFLNGIEATPEGGELRASAEAASGPGRSEVRIVVEDEGQGVSPAIRERIFDPFFTTKPGGTGLGLSISQNIVRQHGGRLRIESQTSGATRAVVVLPLIDTPMKSRTGERKWPTS